MTRLRSSTVARRATADKSSFGEATGALSRVRRGIRTAVTTAIAVMIGGSSSVFACPVCFGAEETSMIEGTKLGILVLLGITVTVQGAFVGFFLYLRKRARRIADMDLDTEWSELQGASRTS
jgi:hypothetical protein